MDVADEALAEWGRPWLIPPMVLSEPRSMLGGSVSSDWSTTALEGDYHTIFPLACFGRSSWIVVSFLFIRGWTTPPFTERNNTTTTFPTASSTTIDYTKHIHPNRSMYLSLFTHQSGLSPDQDTWSSTIGMPQKVRPFHQPSPE